jgi:hypothetical protein
VRSALQSGVDRLALRICVVVFALAAAGSPVLRAQQLAAADQSIPLTAADGRSNANESSRQPDLLSWPLPRRDALLGLGRWDHTLLGAFQLGARLVRLSTVAYVAVLPPGPATIAPGASNVLRFSAFGPTPHASLDAIAKALKVDQLQRQGMNLRMNSPFGNFRLQYREIFNGRSNSIGGGVGQAAAAASWTTPRFGAGGMFDFTAAALMGTGSINQLMGSGFGTNTIGGIGPAARKQDGPTVAIKLTF